MILKEIFFQKGVILSTLFFISYGCLSINKIEPPEAILWGSLYQPISNEKLISFLKSSIDEAVNLYGEPFIPINKVELRRSRKCTNWDHLNIAEDFSLTELVPGSEGDFVIYLGVDENSEKIWFLLAHEVIHLLNPFIQDWYMEGLASYFAIEFCKQELGETGGWLEKFNKLNKEPYALSYQMIRDIAEVAPETLKSMRCFILKNKKDTLQIDVDNWLLSMSLTKRHKVLAKIKPYTTEIKKYSNDSITFKIPNILYND